MCFCKMRYHWFVWLLQIISYLPDIYTSTIVLRQENSYAVYKPFYPCPGSVLAVKFHKKNTNGLLVYSEDSKYGRFLSITLLPNRKLKIELELRLPQYRTSTDHVILMLDCEQPDKWKHDKSELGDLDEDWHSFKLKISSHTQSSSTIDQIIVTLNDQETEYIFHPGVYFSRNNSSSLLPKFGDRLYVGQLPKALRADATQRALFSAAMQPTHLGIIRLTINNTCGNDEIIQNGAKCISTKPIYLMEGSSRTSNLLVRGIQPLECSHSVTKAASDNNSLKSSQSIQTAQCFDDFTKIINLNESSRASFTLKRNQESDEISLQFRSRRADQFIFTSVLTAITSTRDSETMQLLVAVYLTNGSLHINVENYAQNNLPQADTIGSPQKIDCLSDYFTCADAQWHQIKQTITKNSILIHVDNQQPISFLLPYVTVRLSIQAIHLGFRPTTLDMKMFGSSLSVPRQRFRGCIRQLFYKVKEQNIPLLSVSGQEIVDVHLTQCQIKDYCSKDILSPFRQQLPYAWPHRSGMEYVSFSKPGGYIRVPGWHAVLSGEVSFRLRTTERNGLLIYSSSVNQFELIESNDLSLVSDPVPGGGQAGFDIFALELREGHLFCVINTGSGSVQLGRTSIGKHMKTMTFLSDGNDHKVKIRFNEGGVAVEVDDRQYMAQTADEKTYKYLNLNGIFYIGGVPESIRQVSSFISPEVWSTRLRWDYIGCLGDLRVDGHLWDIELEVRACWARKHVEAHCTTRSSIAQCSRGACANGGRCVNGWNRFICDCHDTNFIGKTCSETPIVAHFNGHQWISVSFGPFPVQSTVEDLIIRFQTKQKKGLLLTTRSPSLAASDCLEVRINAGYLQLIYDFGEETKRYKGSTYVSDNSWHTLRIERRERYLNFTVDHFTQIYDIPKDGRFLSHKQIILGRSSKISEPESLDAFPDYPMMLPPEKSKLTVFIGNIMAFWFNGLDLLQVAKRLLTPTTYSLWRDKLDVTASERQPSPEKLLEFPLSFEEHDSYVEIALPGGHDELVLELWLKADKNFGIILLLENGPSDIVGLELVNGKLNIVSSHQENNKHLPSKGYGAIIDSKWHRIEFTRTWSSKSQLMVQIDQEIMKTELAAGETSEKQLLLIGGIPKTNDKSKKYKPYFHSMYGFAGCVASIQIKQKNRTAENRNHGLFNQTDSSNVRVMTLFSDQLDSFVTWNHVKPGCRQKPNGLRQSNNGNCTPRVCQFGGRCVQQWGTTRCDCSMTSLTGTYCTEVSHAIHVSVSRNSILSFELNPPQNTTRDQLAFGIQVSRPGPVVLFLVQGQGDSPDYLEVSIVKLEARYILLVRYNMGAGLQTLYEPNVDVTDGQYHIVQFVRDGPNGILRVDLENEQINKPKEKHGTHFNGLKQIHLGFPFKNAPVSVSNVSGTISVVDFEGYITGAFFNDVNLVSILRGLVVPGIFLSERRNIRVQEQFIPKMEHLNGVRTRSDVQNQIAANDMKLQTNEDGSRSREFYSGPLIIAKRDCVDPGGAYDSKTCSPYDRSGIVQPYVEFKRTFAANTDSSSKTSESGRDWNADQSKMKQAQPNDSGSNHPNHENSPQDYTNPFINQKPLSPGWFKDYDTKFPEAPFQRTKPSGSNQETEFPNNELGLSPRKQFALNIGLIASVSVGGICVLVALTCVIYRCMRRDEGSYNVDENLAYTGEHSSSNNLRTQSTRISKRDMDMQMNVLSNKDPILQEQQQSNVGTLKSALVVTFSDSCKDVLSGAGALGAQPTTSTDLNSSKQELLSSPSLHSAENSMKRSRLVKIEQPLDRRIIGTTAKSKHSKSMTDSQEWYV